MRIKKFSICTLIILSILISMFVLPVTSSAAIRVIKSYTTSDGVNVRSGPGTNYSVIKTVKKNTTVNLVSNIKKNKSWYKIIMSNGKYAYMNSDYIKIKANQLFLPTSATGYKGYTYSYTLTNTTGKTATFTSSNTKIATVSSKGVVTCKKAGKVTITAKAGSYSISSTLTVKTATVSFKSTTATVYINSPAKLSYTCPKAVTFTSSNTNIATVDSTGKVTGKKTGTVTITAKTNSGSTAKCTVTIKERVITWKFARTTMYKNTYNLVKVTTKNNQAYTLKSSNTNILTISNEGLIKGVKAGSAKITCTCGSDKETQTIKVKSGSTVNITKNSASVNAGMTLYLKSSTSGVKWSSSDTSIATVNKGFVLGKKTGTVIISAKTSKGEATCVVYVKASNPVRFAYASQNSVAKNSTVTLYAITDTLRTAVKFKVIDSKSNSSFVTATKKTAESGRYVWSATKKLTTTGVTTVNVYSKKKNGSWKTCSFANFTLDVTSTTNKKSVSYEQRYASTQLIKFIATWEGFLSNVVPDNLAGGIPTVGHGKVIYAGDTFYNGMTQNEAYAYLVKTVNDSGFTTRMNLFLTENKIKFSQRQFDALISFTYNLGAYAITNHSELKSVLLNSYGKASYNKKGYIDTKSTVLSKSASASSATIKKLTPGTSITLVNKTVYNKKWYKVKLSNSTTGYVLKSHITLKTTSTKVRNLNNVSYSSYVKNYLKYHHASNICLYGLLYRRIDEAEMFFYGNYSADGRYNNYNLSYACSTNSSFKIK